MARCLAACELRNGKLGLRVGFGETGTADRLGSVPRGTATFERQSRCTFPFDFSIYCIASKTLLSQDYWPYVQISMELSAMMRKIRWGILLSASLC